MVTNEPRLQVDWAARYAQRDTPWDLGTAHPELLRRIAAGEFEALRGGQALVAGAGRGHDALTLARAGLRVTAVDLVAALAAELEPALRALGGSFVVADALEWQPPAPFALVFEHTFFCALDPQQRPAWGQQMARVLRPGGRLAALVFPVGKPVAEGGPPHGTSSADLALALGPGFRLCEDVPVEARASKRAWPERWARFDCLDPLS